MHVDAVQLSLYSSFLVWMVYYSLLQQDLIYTEF